MNEEDLKKYVVRIETSIFCGTGFFIEKDKILTYYHVIKDSDMKSIKIFLYNKEDPIYASIIDTNEDSDLALLKIETDNQLYVKIDKKISVGDKCYSYGFPNKEAYYEDLDVSEDKKRKDDPLTFEFEGNNSQFMKFKNGLFEEGFSGSPILNLSTNAVCGMIVISRSTRTDLGGEGVSIDKLSLLEYKDKIETNPPINIPIIKDEVEIGIITIKTVPVKMDDGRILNVSINPVTFKEYDLFCENTNKANSFLKGFETKQVTNINWNDANQYCKWLSEKINQKCTLINSKDWEILETYIIKEKNIDEWCCDGIQNEKKLKTDFGIESVRENLKNLKIGFRYNILNL